MANAPGRSATGIAGYKRTRELFATNARKGVLLSQEIFPGLNGTQTDEEILSVAEVSIIIRLFISIIVYVNYNIIEIKIEALIIYIDYIDYINIYKGVSRGGSYKLGSVLSKDSRNH